MSKHYEKVKGYYDKKLWSKTRVYNAVGKWITAGEYEECRPPRTEADNPAVPY